MNKISQKKLIAFLSTLVSLFSFFPSLVAAQTSSVQVVTSSVQVATDTSDLNYTSSILNQVTDYCNKFPHFVIRNNVIVTSINGSTLTVRKDNRRYTIYAPNAIVVDQYWGQSSLGEIAVGDKISVLGVWSNNWSAAWSNGWTYSRSINAFIIRDLSLKHRITGNMDGEPSFQVTALDEQEWTVFIPQGALIVNRANQSISISSIYNTDKLRIKGSIDRRKFTIQATKIIDLSK